MTGVNLAVGDFWLRSREEATSILLRNKAIVIGQLMAALYYVDMYYKSRLSIIAESLVYGLIRLGNADIIVPRFSTV